MLGEISCVPLETAHSIPVEFFLNADRKAGLTVHYYRCVIVYN